MSVQSPLGTVVPVARDISVEQLQLRVFRATRRHRHHLQHAEREAFQRDRGGVFTFQGRGERKFKCVGLQPLNLVSVSSHKQLPCKKKKEKIEKHQSRR